MVRIARVVSAVAVVAALALGSVGSGRAGAAPVDPPSTTDYPQVTAEPPPSVPATASCEETVLVHDFAHSYYAPGIGSHDPSACPGPWAAVVLTFSASVGGVQFDRIFDIYAGSNLLLSSSTSEPCCTPDAVTRWSVQEDVTRFVGLLATPQPITMHLNNVVDGTYTGVYHTTVKLTFYAVSADAPAAAPADVLLPVFDPANTGGDGFLGLDAAHRSRSTALTFPRNLSTLRAEVFAQGHGTCEEFWWGEPSQCGRSTPYREVRVRVDGVLAGLAPVYPVVFTGANGPGLWEPIPSPRAWHLRPYDLDLTPFVGRLVDGAAHDLALEVSDVDYGDGDFWLVGANVFGTVDRGTAQTVGSLTSSPVTPDATEALTSDPTGAGAAASFTAHRDASWSGTVRGSGPEVTTSVRSAVDMTSTQAGLSVIDDWTWTASSAVARPGEDTRGTTDVRTYGLDSDFQVWDLSDGLTRTVDGPVPSKRTTDLHITTGGVGLAANGAETETYTETVDAACTSRALVAVGGHVVSDGPGTTCTQLTGPPAVVPEAPAAAALAASAAATAAAGAALAGRRRRRRVHWA